MNKRLEMLLERISAWPDEAQAELVDSILAIESKHLGVYRLTDDERAAVRRGLEEMRAGKFATEEEVAAVLDRYR
jgi:predicted transcriptional regulator